MNRFEISKFLQEKIKELPKLKYQTLTLRGIWDRKTEQMKKTKEIKEYKEKCSSVIGKMLQLVRYLSVENLTPKADRINKFRVCYLVYWLDIDIKKLRAILENARIEENRLYDLAPSKLDEIYFDLRTVKKSIFGGEQNE